MYERGVRDSRGLACVVLLPFALRAVGLYMTSECIANRIHVWFCILCSSHTSGKHGQKKKNQNIHLLLFFEVLLPRYFFDRSFYFRQYTSCMWAPCKCQNLVCLQQE